jgi:uncharacterized integral membrane protein
LQFLKTLFWIVLTVIIVLFAKANWNSVELKLWGGLVADAKLPVLLLTFFLLGLVPTLIVHRARIWALKRRLEPLERNVAPATHVPAAPAAPAGTPAASAGDGQRLATDTKVWPTA